MTKSIYSRAIETQKDLSSFLNISPLKFKQIAYVAGADVSYSRVGKEAVAFAGIVVMKMGSWDIVDQVHASMEISFPYIPGLLSFRELPPLIEAYARLKILPDLWLIDGAGIAHPRRMGIAAHFGILFDQPAIGVAKSRLLGTHSDIPLEKGSSTPLYDKQEIIGTILRTRSRVKPLFISPGHRVSIKEASEMVLSCCTKYRLPEPTRAAHNFVTRLRQNR